MKNPIVLALLAVVLLVGVTAVAQSSMSATSTPVTITAFVPEFIGLTAVNAAPVMFDFTGYQDHIANGETNVGAIAKSVPTWTLNYNLKHRTVTVCAYASDLMGTQSGSIPAAYLAGQSVQNGSPQAFFGIAETNCTDKPNAILLDQIKGATSSVNTFAGKTRLEGFLTLQLNSNPGNNQFGSTGLVPAPDTYTGSLYIVAQAI